MQPPPPRTILNTSKIGAFFMWMFDLCSLKTLKSCQTKLCVFRKCCLLTVILQRSPLITIVRFSYNIPFSHWNAMKGCVFLSWVIFHSVSILLLFCSHSGVRKWRPKPEVVIAWERQISEWFQRLRKISWDRPIRRNQNRDIARHQLTVEITRWRPQSDTVASRLAGIWK